MGACDVQRVPYELAGRNANSTDAPIRTINTSQAMKNALKLDVDVGEDHWVLLPEEVPVGPTEIIVLLDGQAIGGPLDDFEPVQPAHPVPLSKLVIEGRD